MKTLRGLIAGLLIGLACTVVGGQVSAPASIAINDEGVLQGRVRAINFVGAGVLSTVVAGQAIVTIAGGVGSSNVVEVSIDLGTGGELVYRTTVTGQAWVTASSIIVCSMFGTSADGQTIETYEAAALEPLASNRVAGTGFDLSVNNPNGATGIFRAHCTGA